MTRVGIIGSSSMRKFRMKQVDVFTDRPLTGNPLAVVLDGEGLSSDEMQAIAREMNLSETTFVLPPTKREANYRVRIFTPKMEIPFAGHPSIGTAYALVEEGRITVKQGVTRFWQELGIGVLPIEIEKNKDGGYFITMTQGQPILGQVLKDMRKVVDALRIPVDQIGYGNLPVQISSTGLNQLMIPVRSLKRVQDLSPSFELLKDFEKSLNATGCCVFTLETSNPDAFVHMRFFAPEAGVNEDPATGSAAGALGAYLAAHGIFGTKSPVSFVIEQGSEIQRPSRIVVTVQQADGAPVVKVGGSAVTVLNGEIVL